jgi:hypothetical protein
MPTLIFLITAILVFVFGLRLFIKLFRRKKATGELKTLTVVILSYAILWCISYFTSAKKTVALGTDICFDDWCATVTSTEQQKVLGNEKANGQFIVLHIAISNHARRIAQKPSEPRVQIIDDNNGCWSLSLKGQQALENLIGKQIPLDVRLELHQSLQMQLVFDIPLNVKNLKAVIEEGPFITKFLLQDDKEVFDLSEK